MMLRLWGRITAIIWVTVVVLFILTAALFAWLGIRTDWTFLVDLSLVEVPLWVLLLTMVSVVVVGISFIIASYLIRPYELIRAKLNWLILEKYHHPIFRQATSNYWFDESVLSQELNLLRDKLVQLTTDLQEFSAAPTFVGEETKEEIIEAERLRIARELHDSVSQELFAVTMILSSVTQFPEEAIPETLAKPLQTIEEIIANAQSEMRALLLHLRPVELADQTLKEGITSLLSELNNKVALAITWDLTETQLESGIEDHLFRIVQEVISNTLRHAKAKHLEVYLNQDKTAVQLKIIDDGVGFNPDEAPQKGSYGLINIGERVQSLGGTLKIKSAPGKGTIIDINVPINQIQALESR